MLLDRLALAAVEAGSYAGFDGRTLEVLTATHGRQASLSMGVALQTAMQHHPSDKQGCQDWDADGLAAGTMAVMGSHASHKIKIDQRWPPSEVWEAGMRGLPAKCWQTLSWAIGRRRLRADHAFCSGITGAGCWP